MREELWVFLGIDEFGWAVILLAVAAAVVGALIAYATRRPRR